MVPWPAATEGFGILSRRQRASSSLHHLSSVSTHRTFVSQLHHRHIGLSVILRTTVTQRTTSLLLQLGVCASRPRTSNQHGEPSSLFRVVVIRSMLTLSPHPPAQPCSISTPSFFVSRPLPIRFRPSHSRSSAAKRAKGASTSTRNHKNRKNARSTTASNASRIFSRRESRCPRNYGMRRGRWEARIWCWMRRRRRRRAMWTMSMLKSGRTIRRSLLPRRGRLRQGCCSLPR
jgi:hypothetical protein